MFRVAEGGPGRVRPCTCLKQLTAPLAPSCLLQCQCVAFFRKKKGSHRRMWSCWAPPCLQGKVQIPWPCLFIVSSSLAPTCALAPELVGNHMLPGGHRCANMPLPVSPAAARPPGPDLCFCPCLRCCQQGGGEGPVSSVEFFPSPSTPSQAVTRCFQLLRQSTVAGCK